MKFLKMKLINIKETHEGKKVVRYKAIPLYSFYEVKEGELK